MNNTQKRMLCHNIEQKAAASRLPLKKWSQWEKRRQRNNVILEVIQKVPHKGPFLFTFSKNSP